MALILRTVPAASGRRWVRDGWSLFARRPLAFTALFMIFLLAALVLAMLPVVGGLLQLMLLPLLSLGFMVASQSALLGGPVHPRQFVEPLRAEPQRRQVLLQMCVIYGVVALALLLLCDVVSDGAMRRLQELMADQNSTPAQVDAILAEPGVQTAVIVGLVGAVLLSIPFWHAPALVHWGGQGLGQALFSSTLAILRSKAAFLVYGLTWVVLIFGFGMITAVVFGLLGARSLASLVALPAGLMFSTVFYVSLLFAFNDSFGGSGPVGDDPPPTTTQSGV